ncbi:hypothetical protein EYF80_041237 [Liparis tanakae]|uniref:Uncharacterized protein n=1 Tax=Liparis tanakae TaxID=230148 RepID=A0A4Z2G5M6_9TELE|nr:hypothetical protein EYF80_041237 [Liparis tanakae]
METERGRCKTQSTAGPPHGPDYRQNHGPDYRQNHGPDYRQNHGPDYRQNQNDNRHAAAGLR